MQQERRRPKRRPVEVGTQITCCLGALLLALVAAKAICGAVLLTSSSSVKRRTGFADVIDDPSRRNATLNPRMCVCDSKSSHRKMDPLGRMGMVGGLTSERFCRRCWSSSEVAGFRRRLARGSSLIPWAVWLLASPLLLLVFMPHVANWPKLQVLTPRITVFALCADIILCLLMGAFSLDWGAFKNLCVNGHAFDETYHVEVGFVDSLYYDVCAYSAAEQRMLLSIGAVILLDIIVIVIICYMRSSQLLYKPQTRKTHELLQRLSKITDTTKAFAGPGKRQKHMAQPEVVGKPEGTWGAGLSLMNFDYAHRRKRREERRLREMHQNIGHQRGPDLEMALPAHARGARANPKEKAAPPRSDKRRPTHPWLKDQKRKRSQSPQPKGDGARQKEPKERKGRVRKPPNEFVTYARIIARSKGKPDDGTESLDELESDKLLELFHPPVVKKTAARFL